MNSTTTRRTRTIVGAATIATTLALAGCGSDGENGAVEVSGAWARTSPMMAEAGAAYMTIESDEAISIVSVSVPAEVAGVVELHETVPIDGDHGDDAMDGDAMDEPMDQAMTMQQVTSIEVPAGGSVSLAPGGLHVMLLDLPDPLELGETFDLVLVTAAGEEIVVPIEVRDQAP